MHSNRFINKIRIYALFSFLIPLITINLCLLSYKLLGNIEIYKNYNWDKKFEISAESKTLIIAEIGQSHLGNFKKAKLIIKKISKTGADIVKFQTHLADHESTNDEPFRVKNSKYKNRIDYWKKMEFSFNQWKQIKKECEKNNILFLSSPFSHKAVDLLKKLNVKAWKIGSGEFFSTSMIDKIIKFKEPIIISTGLSRLNEIDAMVKKLKKNNSKFILMQCTSLYPSKLKDIGINILDLYKKKFKCNTGLSDHSGSIYPSIYAMCKSVSAIEVHVGDTKEKMNPDSSSSISFNKLRELCKARDEVFIMRKNKLKKNKLSPKLNKIKKVFTKSCTVKYFMKKGEILNKSDIVFKKPGTGIPDYKINLLIGKKLKKNIYTNKIIKIKDIH